MKVFFFLGQTFFNQSIGIAREIKAQHPNSEFRAIIAARSNLMDELDNLTDLAFAQYDWLSGLEKTWLNTPLDRDKLAKYEQKLGTQALRRIITADRELGMGLVSCGIVEKSDLISATINNDEARWSYIVGLLDYYFDEFEQNRPDIIFAYCVAGAVAYTLGVVAEHLGIPFSQPVSGRVKDYYIIDDNYHWDLNPVTQLFNEAIENPALIKGKLPEAKEFLNDFRNRPRPPQETIKWQEEIRKQIKPVGFCKTIATDIARWGAIRLGMFGTKDVVRQRYGWDIMKLNLTHLRALRKTVNGKMKAFQNDVGDTPYIYYPLHVDPEASTMVLSDMFTDQMAVIESIAKTMPAGMQLIVKEHIPCVGRRPKGFYERINNMPDVKLVNPFSNNFDLIKNAALTCTITGTGGWEAMMLGKPVIVLGDVHYLKVGEGFVHTQDLSQMGGAIKEALTIKPASDKALETYIVSTMTIGISISAEDMWFEKHADLKKREKSVKKMAHRLIGMAQVNCNKKNKKVA